MGLLAGTPAPLFTAPSPVNPRFAFGSLGGRYILLAFLPEPGADRDAALAQVASAKDVFRDDCALFFGVLPDVNSLQAARNAPPFRWFGDPEGELRRLYAAESPDGGLEPQWVLIDPSLRVMGSGPLPLLGAAIAKLRTWGDPDDHAGVPVHAPVLIAPRIFEPELCRELIACYQAKGGSPSGVMVQKDGKTVGVLNDMKRRRDAEIEDEALRNATNFRLHRRLLPEIAKAFQFEATRIERYIVACYDSAEGGFFNPHRDNTTLGTAHRKFAVSINLNAEDFEGGDLRFPEFGRRTYRPPTGGAVVFSCSLLHEATPVTRGVRYAFLPFLYDEAGARIRQQNAEAVDLRVPSVGRPA